MVIGALHLGELPSLHSSQFAPVPGATLQTGIIAMTTAALEVLSK